MEIKVCGNKTHKNLLEISKLEIDMMGFIFYDKSPRFVDVETLKLSISKFETVQKVGVFVNEKIEKIIKIKNELNLNFVQLHGDESPEYCLEMKNNIPVIKALDGNNKNLKSQVELFKNSIDFYLIDCKGENFGGTGNKFDYQNLIGINFTKPFIIAGGICANDIELIKQLKSIPNFYGIDLNSKFEIEPGIKNIELLKTFINTIRNEA